MNHVKKIDRKSLRKKLKNGLFSEAMIELTDSCNFKCIHCYNDNSFIRRDKKEIFRTIEILEQLGVIYIILTGGEPMTHPDFSEIFLYLKKRGFVVTIFTNASRILKFENIFSLYPPQKFSISIYGINNEMYNIFTQTKGQYSKVVESITWLKKHGIEFELKTLVTKFNYSYIMGGEYDLFAADYETIMKYNVELFKTENNNVVINKLLLDKDEMIEFVYKPGNDQKIKNYIECQTHIPEYSECTAGRTSLVVCSNGDFCICIQDVMNSISPENKEISDIIDFLNNRKNTVKNMNYKRKCSKCYANEICNGECCLGKVPYGGTICQFHNTMLKKVRE